MESLVVSSAAGSGRGGLRAFEKSTGWAPFGPDAIRDPRAVRRRAKNSFFAVNDASSGVWLLELDGTPSARIDLPAGLDPGGGAFGSGDDYYVGSRSQRSIERVDLKAQRYCGRALALDDIVFPRGFAVLGDREFLVASGTHPVIRSGHRALLRYDSNGKTGGELFVEDPLLDPLDLVLHNGFVYVTSELPFGEENAVVSLRRYDARTGASAGSWSPENTPAFNVVRKPRGIAFMDDETLLLCAQNCVLAVDVTTVGIARVVAQDDRLAGQSLAVGAVVTRSSDRAVQRNRDSKSLNRS